MPKKVLFILGNGFSIDLIGYLKEQDVSFANPVDLKNLFRLGAQVPWPENQLPGFLSFKHCPFLWQLGARTTIDADNSIKIIEDILTCINMLSTKTESNTYQRLGQYSRIYLNAYKELVYYLKYLFVYYDSAFDFDNEAFLKWNWAQYLSYLSRSPDIERVDIITFNYDLWIERILARLGIPFSIYGLDENEHCKIHIFKVHGSISFMHRKELDNVSFQISYDKEIADSPLDDFEISYDNTILGTHRPAIALIPPAGESERMNNVWAKEIRLGAINTATHLTDEDDLIISGISYWHVDRREIDSILLNCNANVNLFFVNPSPPRTIEAVLSTVFPKYIHYPSSDIMIKRMR